ncbi:hypothetical protein PRIC2_014136 [Phytophthora ramorum]
MRLSYVLLVATATTLLASGNALPAATSADQATAISSTGSSVLITSHEIDNGAGNDKRFLRSHKVKKEDDDSKEDDDDDDDEEEEEERKKGPGFFDSQRLEKMLGNRIYRSKWFNRWKNSGYTPGNVESEMGNKLYQKYRIWYYYGPGARRN